MSDVTKLVVEAVNFARAGRGSAQALITGIHENLLNRNEGEDLQSQDVLKIRVERLLKSLSVAEGELKSTIDRIDKETVKLTISVGDK